MKIVSVVGARPQFVKLAPMAQAFAEADIEHLIVHTGQHYDEDMSDAFFELLNIPAPDINLAIGSGSHGVQTGTMMTALEPVLAANEADWVLVYGDTNSTLAAALCATKLHLPLAHLEAGLRSFNRQMPEEHNRVLTDHSADLCLAPTENAMAHLANEGLHQRSVMVGDVMTDVLLKVARSVQNAPVDSPVGPGPETLLATIHRPANTDVPERLESLLRALAELSATITIPMHPRLQAKTDEFNLDPRRFGLRPVPPLNYPQLVQALTHVSGVVTDSGGLQKEAYILGVPTTTLRSETEWVETLQNDWNVLADSPEDIANAVRRPRPTAARGTPFGTGSSANSVVQALRGDLNG